MNGKLILCLLAGSALSLLSTLQLQTASQSKEDKSPAMKTDQKESPFACNVKALNAEQRKRWLALLGHLSQLKQEVSQLPDGYAFRFPAESEVIQELAEFVAYERLCCPFFDFELKLERENGPFWLSLRGREGVKEFIRSEFRIS
jgi:hypothetical protein